MDSIIDLISLNTSKGHSLHSKFIYLSWKYVFLENVYNENDLDWCRRYLDI